MADNSKQTVIEEGTEFEGSIRSKCGIRLSGKAEGNLKAPSLTVTSTGSVNGDVTVDNLKSDGEIAGEIKAESVELSGSVSDDTVINAKSLEVKLRQSDSALRVSFGNCKLQVGEKHAPNSSNKSQESSEPAKKLEPTRL